jgi:formamidopyrimidine-DNA glycosylase
MPELPEVETIRQGLKKQILGKPIANIIIKKKNLVRDNIQDFQGILQNNAISQIDRIGKLLLFKLAKQEKYLAIHLKMTGQLIYSFKDKLVAGGHNLPIIEDLPNKFSHIIFDFKDGSKLFFNDMRQFGYLQLLDKQSRGQVIKKYGIEPLSKNFTLANFKNIFVNRKCILKALLLNQQIISGLGNIYVDEVCFRARVLPDRRVNTLSDKELKAIYQACQYIIKKAIDKNGTTFSDYRDSDNKSGNYSKYLKVYGRQGKKCVRCKKSKIKKITLAGRGTHFCTTCQK